MFSPSANPSGSTGHDTAASATGILRVVSCEVNTGRNGEFHLILKDYCPTAWYRVDSSALNKIITGKTPLQGNGKFEQQNRLYLSIGSILVFSYKETIHVDVIPGWQKEKKNR